MSMRGKGGRGLGAARMAEPDAGWDDSYQDFEYQEELALVYGASHSTENPFNSFESDDEDMPLSSLVTKNKRKLDDEDAPLSALMPKSGSQKKLKKVEKAILNPIAAPTSTAPPASSTSGFALVPPAGMPVVAPTPTMNTGFMGFSMPVVRGKGGGRGLGRIELTKEQIAYAAKQDRATSRAESRFEHDLATGKKKAW